MFQQLQVQRRGNVNWFRILLIVELINRLQIAFHLEMHQILVEKLHTIEFKEMCNQILLEEYGQVVRCIIHMLLQVQLNL